MKTSKYVYYDVPVKFVCIGYMTQKAETREEAICKVSQKISRDDIALDDIECIQIESVILN